MKRAISKLFNQYARIMGVVLVAWLAIGLGGSLTARPHKVENRPVVRVVVYNYAHVGRLGLHDAEYQAAALFDGAGVRIDWTNYLHKRRPGLSQSEIANADFFIRILPASMARRCNYKPGALGESASRPGSRGPLSGGTANVFYGRVKHVSLLWGLGTGEVLGDAIAHELGHLLGASHSKRGIMKAHWTQQDVLLASKGQLHFSPGQVAALQRAARSLQRNRPVRLAARQRIRPDALNAASR